MSKRSLLLLGLGAILILAQCVWAGEVRHVATVPRASDLVGNWRPPAKIIDPTVLDRSESITLSDSDLRAATIRLAHDGTCGLEAIHNGFGRHIRVEGEYRNLECRWAVSMDVAYVAHKEEMVPVVHVDISAVRVATGRPAAPSLVLYIGRDNDHFFLWDYAGDPDQEIVVQYTRAP